MNEIAFLCDQKADCSGSPFCGKECTHTRDIEHAKNFAMRFENENGCKYIETMKKGHWVQNHDSDHAWKCSECGCGYTDNKLSFCYDCGADMRAEATE